MKHDYFVYTPIIPNYIIIKDINFQVIANPPIVLIVIYLFQDYFCVIVDSDISNEYTSGVEPSLLPIFNKPFNTL